MFQVTIDDLVDEISILEAKVAKIPTSAVRILYSQTRPRYCTPVMSSFVEAGLSVLASFQSGYRWDLSSESDRLRKGRDSPVGCSSIAFAYLTSRMSGRASNYEQLPKKMYSAVDSRIPCSSF